MSRLTIILLVTGASLVCAAWYGFVPDRDGGKHFAGYSPPSAGDSLPAALTPPISDEPAASSQRFEHEQSDRLPADIQGMLENSNLTADEKIDQLWKTFEIHAQEPETARYLLDTMQFIKPKNKEQIIERIENSLHRGSYDDGVRRSLVNLLSSQFERNASMTSADEWQLPGNPLVLGSLRKVAGSSDHATAHQATLQYSRLGETQDSIALLDAARSNGTININEYVNEISFHLPLIADPGQQLHLLGLIENSGLSNQELAQILATTAQLPYALASLAPDTLRSMRRILDSNPPAFAIDSLDLDVLALARYNNWAKASSTIANALSGEPVPNLLASLVMQPDADPRGLIAVAASPMSEPMMDVLIERGLVEDALRRLDRFQLAALNDAEASGIVADIQMRLAGRSHRRSPMHPEP